jgi:dihydropteroate synthase
MRNFIKTSHRKILLDKRPLVMGILNVTPDSFSDGSRYFSTEKAVEHALEMQSQGADIIDVGGESTRPGSLPVTDSGEIERVLPVFRKLTGRLRIPLSIDTSKSNVAEACLAEGAEIVNDISGLRFDPRMASVAAAARAAVIIMHTKSAPRVMQVETEYDALLDDIASYIKYGISRAIEAGISDDSIIIDPGIGFGKTKDQNLIILKNLDYFIDMDYPVLIGTSKKSFIGAALNVGIDERLEGTLAVDALVTLKGADIIRTHDVIATRRVIEMVRAVETAPSWV